VKTLSRVGVGVFFHNPGGRSGGAQLRFFRVLLFQQSVQNLPDFAQVPLRPTTHRTALGTKSTKSPQYDRSGLRTTALVTEVTVLAPVHRLV
jgi:hypothetical protein